MNALRLSISGLGRVIECGLSALLPQVKQSYPAEWRDLGDSAHDFLKMVPEVGVAVALERAAEAARPYLSRIDVSRTTACRPDDYAREVAFAWDWFAGKAWEIGRGMERRYPVDEKTPTVICGTADVIGVAPDRVIVEDFKTGWGHLTRAKDNWQLAGYAIAAALTYDRPQASVGLVRLREGDPWYDRATLDEMDLAGRAAEVSERLGALLQADPAKLEPNEGEWCRWCPSFDHCPAKQLLARSLLNLEPSDPGALTQDGARRVVQLVAAGRELLDRIEERLKEYARAKPVDLGNGQVYGPYQKKLGDAVSVDASMDVLRARYGDDTGIALHKAALKETTAFVKERFRDALRPVADAKGLGITAEVDAAFKALREAGAAIPRTTVVVGAHKQSKEKGATP